MVDGSSAAVLYGCFYAEKGRHSSVVQHRLVMNMQRRLPLLFSSNVRRLSTWAPKRDDYQVLPHASHPLHPEHPTFVKEVQRGIEYLMAHRWKQCRKDNSYPCFEQMEAKDDFCQQLLQANVALLSKEVKYVDE